MGWLSAIGDYALDYTVRPFARGALIGGAEFANWAIGKIPGVPEEYMRMNAESLESLKNDTWLRYRSDGGDGNFVTGALEFASGFAGGAGIGRGAIKTSVRVGKAAKSAGKKVVEKVTPWTGKMVERTARGAEKAAEKTAKAAERASKVTKAEQEVALATERVKTFEGAARGPDYAKHLEQAKKDLEAAEKTLKEARGSVMPEVAKKQFKSLAEKGSLDIADDLGAAWSRNFNWKLGGKLGEWMSYGVNNVIPGLATAAVSSGTDPETDEVRKQKEEKIAEVKEAFYKDEVRNPVARFSTYDVSKEGQFITQVMTDAFKERDRIRKLTDDQIRGIVAPGGSMPAVEKPDEKGFNGVYKEFPEDPAKQMIVSYRKMADDLPNTAWAAVWKAYKDNPDKLGEFRKQLVSQIDNVILPARFPDQFKTMNEEGAPEGDGYIMPFVAGSVDSYTPEMKQFREQLIKDRGNWQSIFSSDYMLNGGVE